MIVRQRLVVNSEVADWISDPGSGAECTVLDEHTDLIRLAPAGELDLGESTGIEAFVLDGSVVHDGDVLSTGTYLLVPPGITGLFRSDKGCTLFLKRQSFAPGDIERVVNRTSQMPWLPGQGRLEVMPLHEHQGRSTALVKWPAGEKFVSHQHWGGEEIFVLSGTFKDEHGVYPTGTWLRNPHLSRHHPFVEDETIILVKVGHLV